MRIELSTMLEFHELEKETQQKLLEQLEKEGIGFNPDEQELYVIFSFTDNHKHLFLSSQRFRDILTSMLGLDDNCLELVYPYLDFEYMYYDLKNYGHILTTIVFDKLGDVNLYANIVIFY